MRSPKPQESEQYSQIYKYTLAPCNCYHQMVHAAIILVYHPAYRSLQDSLRTGSFCFLPLKQKYTRNSKVYLSTCIHQNSDSRLSQPALKGPQLIIDTWKFSCLSDVRDSVLEILAVSMIRKRLCLRGCIADIQEHENLLVCGQGKDLGGFVRVQFVDHA